MKSARHKIAQRCEGKHNPQQRRSAGNDGKRDQNDSRTGHAQTPHAIERILAYEIQSVTRRILVAGSLAARRKAIGRGGSFLHFRIFDRKNTNFFWNAYRKFAYMQKNCYLCTLFSIPV